MSGGTETFNTTIQIDKTIPWLNINRMVKGMTNMSSQIQPIKVVPYTSGNS